MVKSNKSSQGQPIAASTWLYGPWLDLIVGCGAWSTPLLLLSYLSIASSTRQWSIIFYALALLFNYPHYMATIYRAYHRYEDFQKYRFFTLYTTALIFLTILLSHVWVGILPWIFTLYLTWSPWHYSGQNYGLFMMYARRAGVNLNESERSALHGAFIASFIVLFLEFHTGPSSDPLFLSLGIPTVPSEWMQIVFFAFFIGFSIFAWSRLVRAASLRQLLPCAVLFSTQFLWFLLPAVIRLKGVVTPQTRYSSGVLAIMHSAQYLWITSYYARREAAGEAKVNWRPWIYFGLLVIGGIALFIPGPWLASRIFHHDFGVSFLIFTALVNIHHFILDGAIWKLRDGRIASLLLNSRDRVSSAAAQAGGRLSEVWSWISGVSQSARIMRTSAAVVLLLWGTVDQVRHYLSLRANLHDLQRAASLDSFDSQLQMRLAKQHLEAGQPKEAEVAWRSAIQSNPADQSPRQALLKFLIEQGRLDEAFSLTDASLRYSPRDAGLLIDRGLLALRLGNSGEALNSWNRALAVDHTQALAHLYLANELDRQARAKEAAVHYQAFLQAVAHQPPSNRPAPEKVIAITLRMADCQTRASQTENARRSYQLAEKLASQTKQPKLESIASVNEAALDAANGKTAEALTLYQHALRLDDSIGDRTAGAQDWLAYGQFLDRAEFPARLVYACYIKSSLLDQSHLDGVQQRFLSEASAQTAERLGASAVAVRRDPEPTLKEALSLDK
jgi:tetratricopeptide (TPR) repeat protein